MGYVIPGWTFPHASLPPEDELAAGCEEYQRARAESFALPQDIPSDDAPVEQKIAYVEGRIRAIAARRGQNLCHETDGLAQLSPLSKDVETGILNASFHIRCQLCAMYRVAVYHRPSVY